jgi:hypothetical protein
MNPQLCIFKEKPTKEFNQRRVRFAIIDQDQTKSYPANFICILPQHMTAATADSSVFAKTFKDKRLDLAKKLLTNALQTESDPQIKKEISVRLKQISPKPTWQARSYP